MGILEGEEKGERAAREAVARPVRVLMVAPSLGILGGQAVQAARLLEALRREAALEVSFLPVNPALPWPLAPLQRVKYLRTVVTSVAYVASLLARVPRHDVLHVFSASYFSFVLAPTPALLAARLFGKRAILNYRSGEAEDHLRRWPTARRTAALADVIAVPSGYLVEVFARFGLRARVVANVVPLERFRFRERRPLRPVFLANRNFEPLYNVACVLRAFALIRRARPDARLVLAGDGSQRAALGALARELGLENVEFVGRVAPGRMHELYDAADVYLNGSDVDNMPGSVIEAYASGTPVVTTDAGGIPYIVEHERTGLLVARGDYEAMAREALRLLEDDALAARVAASARAECRKYNWEAVREEWLSLYRELAEGKAGRPALSSDSVASSGARGEIL